MNESVWVSSLRNAVESARTDRVRDDNIRWKLDELLTEPVSPRQRPPRLEMLAGVVEIIVHEHDNSKQLPIFVSVPIRCTSGTLPAK